MSDKPERFKKSIDRQTVEELFRNLQKSESVSQEEIARALGADYFDTKHLQLCYRAKEFLRKNENIVINKDGHGGPYRRLIDGEIVNRLGPEGIRKISNDARRTMSKVTNAEPRHLSSQDKTKQCWIQSVTGVVAVATAPRYVKRIEQETEKNNHEQLSTEATLDVLKRGKQTEIGGK